MREQFNEDFIRNFTSGLSGTLIEKNRAYGSSFEKTGAFLALLYPSGMASGQYDDALLLVRIFDKMMRIATSPDAFGEDPYKDIAGYAILGEELRQRRKLEKDNHQGE